MEFRELVTSMNKRLGNAPLSREELERVRDEVDRNSSLPEGYSSNGLSLNVDQRESRSSIFYINLEMQREGAINNRILNELIEKCRGLNIDHRNTKFEYSIEWTKDNLLALPRLKIPFNGKLSVEEETTTTDPSQTRMNNNREPNRIKASISEWKLSIEAEGHYAPHLLEIAEGIPRTAAHITLSPNDSERILRNATRKSKIANQLIKSSMRPARQAGVLGVTWGPKPEKGTHWITTPSSNIEFLEEILGKSLTNASNCSGLTCLTKRYHPLELWGGKPLSDMQTILRRTSELELDVLYDHPLLTNQQAREYIERELRELRKGYDVFENHHASERPDTWSRTLLKFAQAIGGQDLLSFIDNYEIDKTNHEKEWYSLGKEGKDQEEKFAKALQGRFGYQPQEIFHVPYNYQIRWQEGGIQSIATRTRREAHLLNLVSQVFEKDPDRLIDDYVNSYVNERPELQIKMDSPDYPLRKLRTHSLPEGKLVRIGVERSFPIGHERWAHHDSLIIGKRKYSKGDEVYVRTHTTLQDPVLLDLQNEVMNKLGVNIS